MRTLAPTSPEGLPYYVYVLGTPKIPSPEPAGLLGIAFGIDYQPEDQGPGLAVLGWYSCVPTQLKTTSWPEPGAGITLIWDECATGDMNVGGYFYVAAYSPATMSITTFPNKDYAEYVNCTDPVDYHFVDIGENRIGWISLGGASKLGDTDGCNPLVESCNDVTSVRPATWGSIKARYTAGSR